MYFFHLSNKKNFQFIMICLNNHRVYVHVFPFCSHVSTFVCISGLKRKKKSILYNSMCKNPLISSHFFFFLFSLFYFFFVFCFAFSFHFFFYNFFLKFYFLNLSLLLTHMNRCPISNILRVKRANHIELEAH